ncbi:paramyosin-like [Cylas formicarius]|uniref:paramyosin-like n=1 Tax=Cylas formicarius TaxID=197179 RepID=UPI0029585CFE|nr:paramyosin-like [Cylas formicarius]
MSAEKDAAVPTPPIFVHTQDLLESLLSNKDKLSKLKDSLEQKETYEQQLRDHLNAIDRANAKKRGTLDAHENFAKTVNEKNSQLRESARKIIDHCKAAYHDRNAVASRVDEQRSKLEKSTRMQSSRNDAYETRIEELTSSLKKIMAENNRKMRESNLRKCEVRKRASLEAELKRLEDEDATIGSAFGDVNAAALEKELEELDVKLSGLRDEKSRTERSISDFDVECEATLARKNDLVGGLQRKICDLENEVTSRSKTNDELAKRGTELSEGLKTLCARKESLERELSHTAATSKLFVEESERTIASAEAEANQIRKDVGERKAEYCAMEQDKSQLLQEIGRVETETGEVNQVLTELKSELHALQNTLRSMEETEIELNERYDTTLAESERLERLAVEKRENQRELTERIEALIRDEDAIIAEMTIRFDVSRTQLENEIEPTESTKRNLERDIDALEARLNEAKLKKDDLNAERERIKEELKRANTKFDETSQCAKRFSALIDESQNAKKAEAERAQASTEFVSPQVVTKPVKRHSNWDSDSSIEAEAIRDLLRRKQRKVRPRVNKPGKSKE